MVNPVKECIVMFCLSVEVLGKFCKKKKKKKLAKMLGISLAILGTSEPVKVSSFLLVLLY